MGYDLDDHHGDGRKVTDRAQEEQRIERENFIAIGDLEKVLIKKQINEIMSFFNVSDLKGDLYNTSKEFHSMALYMRDWLPDNHEKVITFRKLLEAKDAAVRAVL